MVAALRSFFDVTWTSLLRLQIGSDCKPHVVWKRPLGQATLEGSPTVAGTSVLFAVSNADSGLVEVSAATGRRIRKIPVGGISFTPPTVVGGRLYMGAVHGFAAGAFPASAGPVSALPGYQSASDATHRWQSRENGVYASDDGGKTWRRIYRRQQCASSALLRERADRRRLTSPGLQLRDATALHAERRQTWDQTARVGPGFDGNGGDLYWWEGGSSTRSTLAGEQKITSHRSRLDRRTIVDDALLPGGARCTRRPRAAAPQVIISRAGRTRTVTLPAAGAATVRSITAA